MFHESGLLIDGVPGSVESAEGGNAGVEGEPFGSRLGKDLDDFGIGIVVTEVDDVMLVLRREMVEFTWLS